MTGVRYNGMLGFPEEKDLWLRSPGSAGTYIPPQVFTGPAPAGSKVELVINDRSIETQDVLFDKYRFDNIRLAPGSLNAVRIIITEPGGYQRVIEQNMYGKKVHLPRGGLGFISGLGTNRTVDDWTSQGLFGGGRVFYGATETLTLSTTLAAQNNFYLPISNLTTDAFGVLQRGYPLSSGHIGAQAVWLPREYFLFSGDVAQSNGSGDQGAYDGLAFKIKGDWYPSQNIQIYSQYFRYGQDFFNGENLLLRDREGYTLDGKWRINRNWTVYYAMGSVWNNLEHQSEDTLRARLSECSNLFKYHSPHDHHRRRNKGIVQLGR